MKIYKTYWQSLHFHCGFLSGPILATLKNMSISIEQFLGTVVAFLFLSPDDSDGVAGCAHLEPEDPNVFSI